MLDNSGWRRLHPRSWATLALTGAWLLFFASTIFTTRVPYERDILVTVLPLRHYLLERLHAGEFPQWYPYELLGVPFAGSLVASPFHPQVLLFLLLGPAVGTKWSLLLASLIGLAGAYRLARELGASRAAAVTGAYVFGLGGYGVSLVSNPPFLVPFMTAPWMLAAVHKLVRKKGRPQDVAQLALWWSLIFLGGDVQLFLECGFVALAMLVAYRASRRSWMFFAVAGSIAAALVSVELVPALASEDESIRAYWKPTPSLASLWALHPLRLFDFVVPHFVPAFHRLEFGQLFEGQADLFAGTLFVGGLAALLVLLALWKGAPGALLWIGVAVIGVALALGHRGGLLEVWWSAAPVFAKFQIPEKYVALAALAVVPLVAAGADRLGLLPRQLGALVAGLGALVVAAALVVPSATLVGWLAGNTLPTGLSGALATSWHQGLLLSGGFVVALGVAMRFAPTSLLSVIVPALVLVELAVGNAGRAPLASAAKVESIGELATQLEKLRAPQDPPPRVLPARGGTRKDIGDDELVDAMHSWFMPDDSGRGHAVSFGKNSSAARARVDRLMGSLAPREQPIWQRRFNVCYRAADARQPPRAEESVVASVYDPPVSLVRRECLPRAYLASAVPAKDDEGARDRMRQGLADDDAVWEGGPALSTAGGTATWLAWAPEYLKVEINALAPSALVVSDAYARGWTATMDGQNVPIYPTNVAVRGVRVPLGHHIVEMKYRTPGLILGAGLSLLGLVSCLGLLFASRRQKHSKVAA